MTRQQRHTPAIVDETAVASDLFRSHCSASAGVWNLAHRRCTSLSACHFMLQAAAQQCGAPSAATCASGCSGRRQQTNSPAAMRPGHQVGLRADRQPAGCTRQASNWSRSWQHSPDGNRQPGWATAADAWRQTCSGCDSKTHCWSSRSSDSNVFTPSDRSCDECFRSLPIDCPYTAKYDVQ